MSLPKYLNYSNVKPLGFPTKITKAKFIPVCAFNQLTMNDVIRFQINSPGFWDPRSAFINIVVDFNNSDYIVQQLDGSAHSFIDEMIIQCQGTEIERKQDYSALAFILNNMAYSPSDKTGRAPLEGLGYNITRNLKIPEQQYLSSNFSSINTSTSLGDVMTSFKSESLPTGHVVFNFDDYWSLNKKNSSYIEHNQTVNRYQYGVGASYFTKSNFLLTKGDGTTDISATGTDKPGFNPLLFTKNDIAQNAYWWDQMYTTWTDDNKLPYYNVFKHFTRIDNTLINMNNTNGCNTPNQDLGIRTNGFILDDKCDCPALSNNSWEPFFSPIYKQKFINNGKLTRDTIVTGSWCIPILSSWLGVLLPTEDYKYFPIFAFPDLQIDFRLNPFATFTSGYMNDKGDDSFVNFTNNSPYFKPMTTLQKRSWKIIKFEINVDIITFDDAVTNLVKQQIDNGIVLHSNDWILGPQYTIINTANATGTWHCNLSFESLKAVFIQYLSNDYTTYSFCRRLYALSKNLTYLQMKVGLDYYPPLPIEGEAGDNLCKTLNNQYYNNSSFFNSLLLAIGKFHDIEFSMGINQTNFAVNERYYDVTNKQPFLSGGITTKIKDFWSQEVEEEKKDLKAVVYPSYTNKDTAIGLPLYYENQYIGKCIYGIPLDSLPQDSSTISGISTKGKTPFEINIKSDSNGVTPERDRPCTMQIWCYYDCLLQINKNKYNILGR